MPKKLLLADDSVTIQKVIGISFANEDVTLVTVDNGDDAIAKTRELLPDLVLADVVMPGKTGYEVCETIKSDPNLCHIPVLLLTGTFEAFDEDRARQVGAAGHVAKPFEAQTLVDKVNQLLEASAATPPSVEAETAAPAALVAEAADEGFDFFSDDLAHAEPIAATPAAETIVAPLAADPAVDALLEGDGVLDMGDPLNIKSSSPGKGDAFTFSDDSFQDLNSEPIPLTGADVDSPQTRAESTVAILPDSDDLLGPDPDEIFSNADASLSPAPTTDLPTLTTELIEPDVAAPGDDLVSIDADPIEPVPATAIETPAATRLFDNDLGETPATDSVDLAQATVLDPGSASGFDVSSSDLDDPILGEPIFDDPLLDQPIPAAATVAPPAPVEMPAPVEQIPVEVPESPPVEHIQPVVGARDEDAIATEDKNRAVLDAVVPKVREQLHDTLEKVAWESFGSIAEEIVRQAVERVEAVAWEVIPKLAETLIQEEIRRLKGDE